VDSERLIGKVIDDMEVPFGKRSAVLLVVSLETLSGAARQLVWVGRVDTARHAEMAPVPESNPAGGASATPFAAQEQVAVMLAGQSDGQIRV